MAPDQARKPPTAGIRSPRVASLPSPGSLGMPMNRTNRPGRIAHSSWMNRHPSLLSILLVSRIEQPKQSCQTSAIGAGYPSIPSQIRSWNWNYSYQDRSKPPSCGWHAMVEASSGFGKPSRLMLPRLILLRSIHRQSLTTMATTTMAMMLLGPHHRVEWHHRLWSIQGGHRRLRLGACSTNPASI